MTDKKANDSNNLNSFKKSYILVTSINNIFCDKEQYTDLNFNKEHKYIH